MQQNETEGANSTFSPQNFVRKADGSLLLEKFLKQLAVAIVGIHYIGVSPNFKITVQCSGVWPKVLFEDSKPKISEG